MVRQLFKINLVFIRFPWFLLLLTASDCGETEGMHLIGKAYVHTYPEKRAAKKAPIYIDAPYNYNAYDEYKELFNGCVIIGKAVLTNRPIAADTCIRFGKKVGADIVLLSLENQQKVVRYRRVAVPDKEIATSTKESTNTLGALSDTFWDTLLDNKRRRITITPKNREQNQVIYKYVNQPYTEIQYDQTILFLKKANIVRAPWEYTFKDFTNQKNDQEDPCVGDWVNYETGKLTLLATENEYIAFISRDKKYKNKEKRRINKRLKWKNGDIKLRINKSTKKGWYLDSEKIPVPVYIAFNEFNHLEIRTTDKLIITLDKKQ